MRSRQGRRAALAPALALACIVALTAPGTAARLLAEGLAPAPAPAVGVAGTQSMDALGLPGLPDIKVSDALLPKLVLDAQHAT